jgi:DNA-binding XRE family transcriptional regulator
MHHKVMRVLTEIGSPFLPGGLHKKFGARIRYLRLKQSLSQEKLAEECGLDRTYVGGIERGERNPGLKNISLLT